MYVAVGKGINCWALVKTSLIVLYYSFTASGF